MRLCVIVEHRFDQTPDGLVWTRTAFPHKFWTPYLSCFEHVRVIARVRTVQARPVGALRADSSRVSVAAVPYYVGPWQYLKRARAVRLAVKSFVGGTDALILRLPSNLANSIDSYLRVAKRPYGVEVVGDPYEVFAPRTSTHFLRPFFRWWFTTCMKRQCEGARAVKYVCEKDLPNRYPTNSSAWVTCASDLLLSAGDIVVRPRKYCHRNPTEPWKLITVGSLAQRYKGVDILIEAIARCRESGVNAQLKVVGDGNYRRALVQKVRSLGLDGSVIFCGELTTGAALLHELDQGDLFVLASRTEGLPRVVIEAMARGMPCIGTAVGGIPQLLQADDMVPPENARDLAEKICAVLSDPRRMNRMAAANLIKARGYESDKQLDARKAFYQHVRLATEKWMAGRLS